MKSKTENIESQIMAENHPSDWKKDVLTILKSKSIKITLSILISIVFVRIAINKFINRTADIATHSVKVAPLSLRTVDKTLNLPGNVEAIEQATLYAHVSGYLKKTLVDEGDKVKQNQLLAIIDAPDILQEYRNAKAEFDFKEVTRKRDQQLLAENVISQQEYDRVDAEANQAKARFDNAAANQDYTYVRAPFAGGIARRLKYPGDFISAPTKGGTPSPLFILVNEGRLRIAVNAPQKEMSNIVIGHTVDIRVDTFPTESFPGLVSRIDALLDEATKTQRILIDIKNPGIQLRAGMFASVVLHVLRKENVPMVIKDAVHEDADKPFVFVIRSNKAKKIAVTVGDAESGYVEIISPSLEQSDRIVVSGWQGLADGDNVDAKEEGFTSDHAIKTVDKEGH